MWVERRITENWPEQHQSKVDLREPSRRYQLFFLFRLIIYKKQTSCFTVELNVSSFGAVTLLFVTMLLIIDPSCLALDYFDGHTDPKS